MMPRSNVGLLVAAGLVLATAAHAEWLAPLVTETAETIPSASAQVGIGFAYDNDGRYPGFTPPDEINAFSRSRDMVGTAAASARSSRQPMASPAIVAVMMECPPDTRRLRWGFGRGFQGMACPALHP